MEIIQFFLGDHLICKAHVTCEGARKNTTSRLLFFVIVGRHFNIVSCEDCPGFFVSCLQEKARTVAMDQDFFGDGMLLLAWSQIGAQIG